MRNRTLGRSRLAVWLVPLLLGSPAVAQVESPPPGAATPRPEVREAREPREAPEIIEAPKAEGEEEKPNPFVGDVFTRERLTGDWFAARSALAGKGLNFDVFSTQFYQGVTSGGREREWQYGGKLDYLFDLDGGKLGLWQGFFLNLHGETRYGESVNNVDGLLAPSNIVMSFPAADQTITSLTGIKFTQALGENFAVFGGKLNTLDDYALPFAPQRGLKPGQAGFQSTALVFNPIIARTIPYSAIGNGFAILKDKEPLFTLTVFDPRERATIGFQDPYAEGVVIVPDLILRTKFFGLRGLWNVGGSYSNAKYRSLQPEAYLNVPLEIALGAEGEGPQETGSWSVYGNFYQAVWASPTNEKHTWGPFASFGLADGNPNPFDYTLLCGIGGESMLPGRDLDTFGVGYYYLGLSNTFKDLTRPTLPQRDEWGVEMFYNVAITPWCRLTYDCQFARPSTIKFDTAVIQGVRFQLLF